MLLHSEEMTGSVRGVVQGIVPGLQRACWWPTKPLRQHINLSSLITQAVPSVCVAALVGALRWTVILLQRVVTLLNLAQLC